MRIDSLYALGRIKELSEDAIPYIIDCLNDEDETVRLTAAKVLGDFENLLALDALCESLNDENERVRSSVIVSLGMLGDETAIEPLGEVYWAKEKSEFVRIAVIQALRQIKGKEAIELMTSALLMIKILL